MPRGEVRIVLALLMVRSEKSLSGKWRFANRGCWIGVGNSPNIQLRLASCLAIFQQLCGTRPLSYPQRVFFPVPIHQWMSQSTVNPLRVKGPDWRDHGDDSARGNHYQPFRPMESIAEQPE